MTEVTADNLNSVMEFDHVIRVAQDGTVSDSPLDPYITLNMFEESDGVWVDEFTIADGWQLLTGFSGQHGYAGPVMHQSEYIGGGMARHILETPGDYVALVVESQDMHRWEIDRADGVTQWCPKCGDVADDGNTDTDATCPGADPAGWAVAFKPAPSVRYEVAITGDVTDDAHAAIGATRANGWIDPKWSMTVLHDNREDVRTEVFETKADALEYIESTIGAVQDNGDGSYYAQDAHQDMHSGDVWSYAAHITITETGE